MSWPDVNRLRWTPTQRVAADDGTELAVEVLGDAHEGPTLVFLHGWTLSSRFWHYQRALAERRRLVLVDHRDHGQSGTGPRPHRTIDQLGRDLATVLEATCAGREVVLVGHSMGGMTIMALADQRPELFGAQVRGVALVNTSGARKRREPRGPAGRLTAAFERRFEASLALMVSDPERAEHKRATGSALSVAISRYLNLARGADRRLARFTEALSGLTAAEAIGDFWLSLDEHDKTEALATLGNVETLVIVGDRDRLTPPPLARSIAAAVPGSRLLELRGAGHCSPLELPGAVTAALDELAERATATVSAPKPRAGRRRRLVAVPT